jgi:threonine/homoserine/homoserine lactone efflux protein
MLSILLFGSSYGFAAVIQPGPLQAFLVSRIAATGWRRTLPACFSPLLSDVPIALVALFLLDQLPPIAQNALQAGGGLLLVYLAWIASRQLRRSAEPDQTRSAPRTFFEAALVNLLNPHPWLGWTLVLGPLVHRTWSDQAIYAVALIVAFYATMVVTLAGFILLVGTVRFLGSRAQRALVGASVAILAGLGLYLLASAVLNLGAA